MKVSAGITGAVLFVAAAGMARLAWIDFAFCAGVLIGFAAALAGHVYSIGGHRWRLRVTQGGYGSEKVRVEARRLWETVKVAEVKADKEGFDERLHEAVAEGRVKVAALNAQRGR